MTNEIKTNAAPLEPSELPDDKSLPKLALDPDKYRNRICEYYQTEEQQNEVLRILWNIGEMLIDMKLGVDSIQVLLPDLFENAGVDSGKLVQQNKSQTFNSAVENNSNSKEKNDG